MSNEQQAVNYIRQHTKLRPHLGIVLGSGLGAIADSIDDATLLPYSDIPGFPTSSTIGHHGRLVLGYLKGLPVVCLQGRNHSYEGMGYDIVRTMIRSVKLLGCEQLLLTNAAGSLKTDMTPGELMLLTDHINLQPGNPLVGPNDDDVGPRFFQMNDAYDSNVNEALQTLADNLGLKLHEGVYISVCGPNYETPAEIRAFRIWGADAVGMSTVPEVLVARHCGLTTAAISIITNMAAGLCDTPPNQDETIEMAAIAANNLTQLIQAYGEKLANDYR